MEPARIAASTFNLSARASLCWGKKQKTPSNGFAAGLLFAATKGFPGEGPCSTWPTKRNTDLRVQVQTCSNMPPPEDHKKC
eukprot:3011569-Amphidinium_carterae.1